MSLGEFCGLNYYECNIGNGFFSYVVTTQYYKSDGKDIGSHYAEYFNFLISPNVNALELKNQVSAMKFRLTQANANGIGKNAKECHEFLKEEIVKYSENALRSMMFKAIADNFQQPNLFIGTNFKLLEITSSPIISLKLAGLFIEELIALKNKSVLKEFNEELNRIDSFDTLEKNNLL